MRIEFDKQIQLVPVSDRWYRIPYDINIDIYMDCGRKRITLYAGFCFDGRSGGPCADFIAPNLGSPKELQAWLIHDCMGYDIGFTFEETNQILYNNLRACGYGWVRAKAIWAAVSMSDSWFGTPKEGDKEYPNLSRMYVRHYDK